MKKLSEKEMIKPNLLSHLHTASQSWHEVGGNMGLSSFTESDVRNVRVYGFPKQFVHPMITFQEFGQL